MDFPFAHEFLLRVAIDAMQTSLVVDVGKQVMIGVFHQSRRFLGIRSLEVV
jgi:hypothetical protein